MKLAADCCTPRAPRTSAAYKRQCTANRIEVNEMKKEQKKACCKQYCSAYRINLLSVGQMLGKYCNK